MPVIIGSKYTGKSKGFVNTETGEYWQALPPIDGYSLEIQKALLQRECKKAKPVTAQVGTQQSAT